MSVFANNGDVVDNNESSKLHKRNQESLIKCTWLYNVLRVNNIHIQQGNFMPGTETKLSEIIIFYSYKKSSPFDVFFFCLPHLKYSFFPQYLFIQFGSVLFLNVIFYLVELKVRSEGKGSKDGAGSE